MTSLLIYNLSMTMSNIVKILNTYSKKTSSVALQYWELSTKNGNSTHLLIHLLWSLMILLILLTVVPYYA